MVSGKVQLFYKDGFTDEGMQIIKRTRFFMIAAGLTIVALSVQVYYFGFEVGLSVPFVVLNGSYIIIKLIFRFIKAFCSKGNKRKEIISAIDVCRQKLATAESMFAFSLIFFKLIDVYNWEDEMLSIMAMVYGGISGIAVIMLGVRRKKEQRVCTPKQPE